MKSEFSGGGEPQQEDEKNYVSIREATDQLGGQNQYVSYYLEGIGGRPNLGEGIRYIADKGGNYHAIKIHKDDVEEFVRRVREYRGDNS